ncbi:MAG: methylmalonyl Co-A mutase-associated GTPase MeaB [Beijerinckiaceae bacterium]
MPNLSPQRSVDVEKLRDEIIGGSRAALARAITLVESRREDHRKAADALVQAVLPHTGNSIRVGITGVPGVGKSTSIDTLGSYLTQTGHKVAVLAVDPSSTRTGGSILGDKTRMEALAADPNAFIRPSPSSGTLGGVASKTRETMLLCEAAGFDVILVETVGIGQSETTVADMTDFFLVLMLPGAGDELQGIKKGVLEIADMIAVNKADGDNAPRARAAAAEYRAALHIMTPTTPGWTPPVMLMSGRTGEGVPALWNQIRDHRMKMQANNVWPLKRAGQNVRWMRALIDERLRLRLANDPLLKARIAELELSVSKGAMAAPLAAQDIISLMETR